MNNKKAINRYDKNDDMMMWELVEIKHKIGDDILKKYTDNEKVKKFLKVFEDRIANSTHSLVSDKKENYKSKKTKK